MRNTLQYLFLDVETTGLREDKIVFKGAKDIHSESKVVKGDEVIQIGGILTNDNLEPELTFCHFCDTLAPLSKKAFEVHKISLEYLRTYVKDIYLEEVITNYLPFLYKKDLVTIGYNIKFDITMITQTLRDFKRKPQFGTSLISSLLPKSGRYFIDLVPFYIRTINGKPYKPTLELLSKNLLSDFYKFLDTYPDVIFESNNLNFKSQTLFPTNHNSFIDSLYCYLLFKKDIWKTKLL